VTRALTGTVMGVPRTCGRRFRFVEPSNKMVYNTANKVPEGSARVFIRGIPVSSEIIVSLPGIGSGTT